MDISSSAPAARGLLTGNEAAEYLRVSPKTLESWRTRGGGPRFVQLRSRAIRYRPTDLDAFIERGIRRSTSDSGSDNSKMECAAGTDVMTTPSAPRPLKMSKTLPDRRIEATRKKEAKDSGHE